MAKRKYRTHKPAITLAPAHRGLAYDLPEVDSELAPIELTDPEVSRPPAMAGAGRVWEMHRASGATAHTGTATHRCRCGGSF
jgi:hypothetical protein